MHDQCDIVLEDDGSLSEVELLSKLIIRRDRIRWGGVAGTIDRILGIHGGPASTE